MSTEPTTELKTRLTGDATSLDRTFQRSSENADKFAKKITEIAKSLSTSLDAALTKVNRTTQSLDSGLTILSARFDTTRSAAASASGALEKTAKDVEGVGAAAKGTAADLSSASKEMRGAEAAVGKVGAAATKTSSSLNAMGRSAATSLGAVQKSSASAVSALGRVTASINRLRAASNKPITQVVRIKQTGGGGRKNTGSLSGAGVGLVTLGASIEAPLAGLVHSGAEFEDELRKLYATAGEKTPFETLRKELLSIALQFDQLPKEVAEAYYPIQSAGFKGADGLKVLSNAAAMAKGTQTDLATTSELVTKTLVAYQLQADKSGQVTDVYTKAIKESMVPGRQFVPAMENVMEVGKMAGLSLQDMSAALATLTQTTKNASTGSTFLKNFISGLITPTKQMRDAAHAAGLEWLATGQGAQHLREVGLEKTIQEISKATNNSSTAFGKLFPDMRKNQAIMSLLNDGGERFTRILGEIGHSSGAVSSASKEMDKSLSQMGRHLQVSIAVAGSNIETALKPILLTVGGFLIKLIDGFNAMPAPIQQGIVVMISGAAAAASLAGSLILAVKFVTELGEAWEVLGPLMEGVPGPLMAIVAVLGILFLAWKNDWGHIREHTAAFVAWAKPYLLEFSAWLKKEWGALTKRLIAFWQDVSPAIQQQLQNIQAIIRFAWATIVSFFETSGQLLWGIVRGVWDSISGVFKTAFDGILGFVSFFINALTGHWDRAYADLVNTAKREWDDIQDIFKKSGEDLLDGFKKTVDSMTAYWGAFWEKLKSGGSLTDAMEAGSDAASKAHGGGSASSARQSTGASQGMYGGRATGSAVGDAIAASAEHMHAQVENFRGMCQQLLRETVQHVTHQYDAYFKGSARETMNAFKKAGIGMPYIPGMQLQPGDMLYSGRMGGQAGHAMLAGANGEILDNVGTGKTTADHRMIDWVVRPSGAAPAPGTIDAPIIPPTKAGAVPAWALALNAKQGGHKGSFLPANLPEFDDLADLVSRFGKVDDRIHGLSKEPTGPANYDAKMGAQDQLLAQAQAEIEKQFTAGKKSVDEHALAVAMDEARLKSLGGQFAITANAIQNATAQMSAHAGKAETLFQQYNRAKGAVKSFYETMQKRGVWTDKDRAAYQEKVRNAKALEASTKKEAEYAAANADLITRAAERQKSLRSEIDQTAAGIRRNQAEQMASQDRLMKERFARGKGSLSRADYSAYLQQQLASPALDQSGPRAAALSAELAKLQETSAMIARLQAETGKLSGKTDFDARREALKQQQAEYTEKAHGDKETLDAIGAWSKAESDKIAADEAQAFRSQFLETQRFLLDAGKETASQYRATLADMLTEVTQKFAQAGYADQALAKDIQSLSLEITRMDWQAIDDQVTSLKESMDDGDLSAQDYIRSLQKLQQTLNAPNTPESRKLGKEIDAAYKSLNQSLQSQADKVGEKGADIFMAVIKHTTTLKEAIHTAMLSAMEDATKEWVKKLISDQALGVLKKRANIPERTNKTEGDKMVDAQAAMAVFVKNWQDGVDKLGQVMQQFTDSVNKYADAASKPAAQGDTSAPVAATLAAAAAMGASAGASAGSGVPAANGGGALGAVSDIARAVKSGGGGSALGDLSAAAGVASDISKVSKWSQAGSVLGTVMPALGVISAVVGLAGMFGSGKKTPSSFQSQTYASAFTNFGSTIDSGYSGADGIRALMGPGSMKAAGVQSNIPQASAPTIVNLHVAEGAVVAHGVQDPEQMSNQFFGHLTEKLAAANIIDNASRGVNS